MRGPLLLQVLIPRPLHSGLSVAIGARLLLKMRKSIAPKWFVISQKSPLFAMVYARSAFLYQLRALQAVFC